MLLDHFAQSSAVNGERSAGMMMRKFAVRFAAHHPGGDAVRRRFISVRSADAWRAVLDEFYAPGSPALAVS